MKSKTKIVVIISSATPSQIPKKPKINQFLLKIISLIIITLISGLNPEAIIGIFLIKLLFIVLQWLNYY